MISEQALDGLLKVYFSGVDPESGYPWAWKRETIHETLPGGIDVYLPRIPDLVRARAGNRCVRCGHPYDKSAPVHGEWTPCDQLCKHMGTVRVKNLATLGEWFVVELGTVGQTAAEAQRNDGPGYVGQIQYAVEAQWRVLTVHHLNGVKHDCRWWNLAALCQRCHLSVQTRVIMERAYDKVHSEWFKPYAAGWYAWRYLGEELTREETMARLDELLALEHRQDALFT